MTQPHPSSGGPSPEFPITQWTVVLAAAQDGSVPPTDSKRARCRQEQIAGLMIKMARAIHYAHQRAILHRDLKPGNILLDPEGEPHVTDFGLAKLLAEDSTVTGPGMILGTPSYMSPEQAAGGSGAVTTVSDVYGLGAILYELLTGRPPFKGSDAAETIRLVLDTDVHRPSMSNKRVDRDIETICLKCLEKDGARRYSSAEALADDFERWKAHEPIHARRSTVPQKCWRWCRRQPALASALAALVITIAVGVPVWLSQWRATIIERSISADTLGFLTSILESVRPDVAAGRDTTVLRQIVDEAAERLDNQFKAQPDVQVSLGLTIGEIYYQLALYDKAEARFQRVLKLAMDLHGSEHETVADAYTALGGLFMEVGKLDEAEGLLRKALALRNKLLEPTDGRPTPGERVVGTWEDSLESRRTQYS